jgi:hypothetical protein
MQHNLQLITYNKIIIIFFNKATILLLLIKQIHKVFHNMLHLNT